MRIFISYCEKDGEGLGYARRAKDVCKQRDAEAWIWRDDGSSVEWLLTDIVENLNSSDAMLTIVTQGTENSDPQKQEWSFAGSFAKGNSSLIRKGIARPRELSAKYCPEFDDTTFEAECEKVVEDIVRRLESASGFSANPQIRERTDKAYEIHNIAKQLDKRREGLDEKTLEEFSKNVWEGYLGSTMVRDVVNLGEANNEDKEKLVHIGILSSLNLRDFNATDYRWGGFFKDIGQVIATREKRFLIEGLHEEVAEIGKPCDEANDELSAVLEQVERLSAAGHTPSVIMAPPSMLKSFVHFFRDNAGKVAFEREHGSAATLDLKGIGRLGIYLPGGDVLTENVILLDRASVVWKVAPNPDTGYALTLGVGKGLYPDKVGFIVGTTARYAVIQKDGIARIPIKR